MNNIEILENAIKCNKKQFEEIGTHILLQDDEMKAIENLIQENKELKDKNMKMAVNGGSIRAKHYIEKNYIPKSKIKEIIGELEKQEDWYIENKSLDDLYGKIDILQELLEEGE